MQIARIYLRVSTDEQELTRQNSIIEYAGAGVSMSPAFIKKRHPVPGLTALNFSA